MQYARYVTLALSVGALTACADQSTTPNLEESPTRTVTEDGRVTVFAAASGERTGVRPSGLSMALGTAKGLNTLYSQDVEPDPFRWTSNGCVVEGCGYGADFVVPAGETWTVSTIGLAGRLENGFSSFEIAIYREVNGVPSEVVFHQAGMTSYTATRREETIGYYSDYRIELPSPQVLPAGRYWLALPSMGKDWLSHFMWMNSPMVGSGARTIRNGVWSSPWNGDFVFALYARANVAPQITMGSGATIRPGSSFTLSASFTDSDHDTWSCTLNWGDGAADVHLTNCAPDQPIQVSHQYTKPGTYTVTLTVQDSKNASDVKSANVVVEAGKPLSPGRPSIPGKPNG